MIKFPPSRIEVFRPAIGEEEIAAVSDVLRSGWIGRGPKVAEFEREWARHIGVAPEHVVSVGCATEGLYQVMQELKAWHSVDSVIIPDNSFIGAASAILDTGLTAIPCDIDRQTLNPDVEHFEEHMRPNAAIVYQHYGGFSSSSHGYDFNQLADLWDAPLVEDMACHPMGRPAGDFAIWSFDAMKVISCGDGGMVYCRDVDCTKAIRCATRLGMDSESGQSGLSDKWWEFTAHVPGRRSLMNDIGAAIGLVQLRRLPELIARRQVIWEYYQLRLPNDDWLIKPPQPIGESASYYTYWVQCPEETKRNLLAAFLRERGIYTTYRYWPVSRAYGWDVDCPNSHWASEHVLNLPLHPGLSDDDVSYIIETIAEFGRTL